MVRRRFQLGGPRRVVAVIGLVPALAACGPLGLDGDNRFEEERVYRFTATDCTPEPELSCSAQAVFCPDGSAFYLGLGSDIIMGGTYAVLGPAVRLRIEQPDRLFEFELFADGQVLVDSSTGQAFELQESPGPCDPGE